MDTKKLRQKILDLAIRGKLVPQDPTDEPTSVLLERIRAEKERLIAEGKIKRPRKTAQTADTHHYKQNLPEGWCVSTIGNLFTLQAGKNISANKINSNSSCGASYPCFGGNGLRGYVSNLNRNGDYPVIGRQGALCGNINLAQGDFYATEHAVTVERYCNVDLMWTFYTLTSLNLNQYATATAQPGLSVNVINDIPITVPPLQEQYRISKQIKTWFDLIEQIEQGKADLQTAIKQAKSKILDLAIHGKLVPQAPNDEPATELLCRINPKAKITCDNEHSEKLPFEIPTGWGWTTLGEVGSWQSGGTPSRSNKSYYGGDIPWLKTGDLNDGLILEIPENITEEAVMNSSAKLNPSGSVLIAMYGATIGKLGILTFPATTNQACCACIEFNAITRLYLFYFLLSQRNILISKGGGGAQPNISKEIITNTFIPVPPLPEQQRIVSKIEELFSILDNIQAALEV